MGEVPKPSWRLLSMEEVEKMIQYSPVEKALFNLVKKGKIRAWLDDKGKLRWQAVPGAEKHEG